MLVSYIKSFLRATVIKFIYEILCFITVRIHFEPFLKHFCSRLVGHTCTVNA